MKKLHLGIGLIFALVFLIGCRFAFATDAASSPKALSTESKSAGRLAYVGADGNVYVTDAARTSTVAVTNNATAPFEGLGLSYQRISWSPGGQLAYAAVTRTDESTTSKLYVTSAPGTPARLVGQSEHHFVIYIYWSPVPCSTQPACRQLAYLIEEGDTIVLRLVVMNDDTVENRVIGSGWPYYFSWAAGGESIIWHTNGTYRFNTSAQISRYDIQPMKAQAMPLKPGSFMAPAWSPRNDTWLGVSSNATGHALQLYGAEAPVTLSTAPKGGAAFVWSPLGDRVAYVLRENSSDPFFGPIFIYDLDTGQTTQITDFGLRPVAFFWDPTGERIGYLTHLSMPDGSWMQWRVYNLSQGTDRGFRAFNPSLHMRFVMNSFNQYAQSHRFWSPDGRYLVYGQQDAVLGDQVRLIDTWSEDGKNSILVDGGTMGFWSWNR